MKYQHNHPDSSIPEYKTTDCVKVPVLSLNLKFKLLLVFVLPVD